MTIRRFNSIRHRYDYNIESLYIFLNDNNEFMRALLKKREARAHIGIVYIYIEMMVKFRVELYAYVMLMLCRIKISNFT